MVAGAAGDAGADGHTINVQVASAFGSHCGSGRLRDAVLFGDERGQYMVHPVGRHVAFRHIESGEATYTQQSRRVEAITACAVSSDRGLFAVCERCSSAPLTQVSIYDLRAAGTKPAKALEEMGGAVGNITCAAFSYPLYHHEDDDDLGQDISSLLCIVSQEPELLLVVLDWRKNTVVFRVNLPQAPTRIAFSPKDSNLLSVSAEDHVSLWLGSRADPSGELRKLDDFQDEDGVLAHPLVDHAWLEPGDGHMLVCTGDGRVHFLNSDENKVVGTIASPFEALDDDATIAPCSLRCFDNGFAFGGPRGLVAVWQRLGDDEPTSSSSSSGGFERMYRHFCTARVRQHEVPVCCLDVAGDGEEMKILLGFEDANIGYIDIDALQGQHGKKSDCTILAGGVHSKPITGLCMAAHRPVIVSVSQEECSLRVWNYAAQCCELLHEFSGEEPNGVAIHPLGFFLVVSFSDKLRFFQVLLSDILPYRDIAIRGVKLPCFSHGGHLVAAVQGKLVMVFDTCTLSKVATIRGLSQQVTALSFSPDDHSLTVMGDDGSLAKYTTNNWSKISEHSSRSSEALSICCGDDGYAWCGLVEAQRSFVRGYQHCSPESAEDIELPEGVRACALASYFQESGPSLLIGTSSGTLWTCHGLKDVATLEEHSLHVGACNALCLSSDGCMAVTAGNDGVIYLLAVSGMSPTPGPAPGQRASVEAGKKRSEAADGDVVMINAGDLKVGQEELDILSTENDALQTKLAEEAVRLQSEAKIRVAEARKKDQEEIQELRLRYESLQQTATAKERESLRAMKSTEAKHVDTADKMELNFEKKVGAENDRYVSLETENITLQCRIDAMRDEAQRQFDAQRQLHSNELAKKIAEKDGEIKKLKDLIEFTQHRYDTMLDQEGIFHDLEVAELNRRCQSEIEQQRLVEYKLKKEQDTLLRGLDTMDKDRTKTVEEQEETALVKANLDKNLQELSAQVENAKQERSEREAVLRGRELEIGNYKQKVSTLNKFKHVLDFRLREVTLSLQPKEQMIAQLNSQLRELEAEFERQLQIQRNMEKVSDQSSEQVTELEKESKRLRIIISEREKQVARFNKDLHELVENEQDVRVWPQGLMKIYKEHVQSAMVADGADTLPMQELQRQIAVVERKVECLTLKAKKDEKDGKSDIQTKTHDNSLLIKELTELRIEQKALNRDVNNLELKVKQTEMKLAHEREAAAVAAAVNAARPIMDAPAGGDLEGMFSDRVTGARTAPATLMSQVKKSGKKSMRQTLQEKKQVQNLLMQADLSNQQTEMQAVENKILRDQVAKLMREQLGQELAADNSVADSVPAHSEGIPSIEPTDYYNRRGSVASTIDENFALIGSSSQGSLTTGPAAGAGLSAVRRGSRPHGR